jgi:hypothetical protein
MRARQANPFFFRSQDLPLSHHRQQKKSASAWGVGHRQLLVWLHFSRSFSAPVTLIDLTPDIMPSDLVLYPEGVNII